MQRDDSQKDRDTDTSTPEMPGSGTSSVSNISSVADVPLIRNDTKLLYRSDSVEDIKSAPFILQLDNLELEVVNWDKVFEIWQNIVKQKGVGNNAILLSHRAIISKRGRLCYGLK